MGIYLNPGKNSFEIAVNSQIYVDKSGIIDFLNSVINTTQRYISVSRPRRFGKTITADMLCAYYGSDSYNIFSGLEIGHPDSARPDWDCNLGKYDVIRVVMTDFIKKDVSVEKSLEKMRQLVSRDIVREYPDIDYYNKEELIQSMSDLYSERQHKFVVIIDEWDVIFRVRKDDKEGQRKYLDFLRDWLKDKDYVALAYITGILPIKKYGEHSALNMFNEYSMTAPMQMAKYTGFTSDEVKALCDEYGRDFEKIKEWYDGYSVCDIIPAGMTFESQKKYSLYSPLSVVNALTTGIIKNYWTKTETYEALADYIRMDFDGLKETMMLLMDGGRRKTDLSKYQNDMTTFHSQDDILALLIHLGYLGFDADTDEVYIPNKEILDEYKTSTSDSEWDLAFESYRMSQQLLQATWNREAGKVAELLEHFHNMANNKEYNSEAALSYAIRYAYYSAQKYYTEILELDTGKGYADIVYIPSSKYPDKPVLLIELKYNKNVQAAIDQIKRQRYPERLSHYKDNILLIGINYDKESNNTDSDFKHHSCIIEKA